MFLKYYQQWKPPHYSKNAGYIGRTKTNENSLQFLLLQIKERYIVIHFLR